MQVEAQKEKNSSRVTIRRTLNWAGYLVVCLFALGLGVGAHLVSGSKVATELVRQMAMNTPPAEVFESTGQTTILILGCDEDVSPGGKKVVRKQARSDTMIVARLDFENNRISGIGIPRDLLVELPGYRNQKINAYHAIGGNELAQKAAEQVLGIKIDRTMVIDYESFIKMVDIAGGVDVFVPKKMKYTDKRANPPLFIDFEPGRHHMNGYQAMCFVRFRHSDDTFHRQARQVDFMMAFKDTLRSKPSLIPAVADQAMEVLGGGFSSAEIAAVARFARGVPKESIQFGTVPVLPAENYNFRLDDKKLPEVLRDFHFVDATRVSANP